MMITVMVSCAKVVFIQCCVVEEDMASETGRFRDYRHCRLAQAARQRTGAVKSPAHYLKVQDAWI